jgi:hypothetical protein
MKRTLLENQLKESNWTKPAWRRRKISNTANLAKRNQRLANASTQSENQSSCNTLIYTKSTCNMSQLQILERKYSRELTPLPEPGAHPVTWAGGSSRYLSRELTPLFEPGARPVTWAGSSPRYLSRGLVPLPEPGAHPVTWAGKPSRYLAAQMEYCTTIFKTNEYCAIVAIFQSVGILYRFFFH